MRQSSSPKEPGSPWMGIGCATRKGDAKSAGGHRPTKKYPAFAVGNYSFEHVLQHVGRAGLLSTSFAPEGLSATASAA